MKMAYAWLTKNYVTKSNALRMHTKIKMFHAEKYGSKTENNNNSGLHLTMNCYRHFDSNILEFRNVKTITNSQHKKRTKWNWNAQLAFKP